MKYRFLLLILLLFSTVSCEKILQKEENEFEVLDTQEDLSRVFTGFYYRMLQLHNRDYLFYLLKGDDIHIGLYLKYNEGTCAWDWHSVPFSMERERPYKSLYGSLVNLNRIIEEFHSNDLPSKWNLFLGEAHLWRAYCYFKLTRFYGKIPIVDNTGVDYYIPLPTYDEIYAFITRDIYTALNLLPNAYDNARIPGVTPHRGTAKALLAEVYLTMGGFPLYDHEKYALSARYAKEVIDSAGLYNFELLPDFAQLWTSGNQFHSETVLGLFCAHADKDGEYKLNNQIDPIYSYTVDKNYVKPRSKIIVELDFYNDYPNSYRKRVTFNTGYYYSASFPVEDYDYTWREWVSIDPALDYCEIEKYIYCKKWMDLDNIKLREASNYIIEGEDNERIYVSGNSQTLYMFRYAHTLLTYAEAKARIGELDESAYEALNKIRRRANRVDLNTPSKFDISKDVTIEQFSDSVVWERALEFYFEPEGRWFDIVRLNMYDNKEEYYFNEIPQEDIWLNPNLEEDTNE